MRKNKSVVDRVCWGAGCGPWNNRTFVFAECIEGQVVIV